MRFKVNSSGYDCTKTYKGGYEAGANKRREEIINAPNTEEIYNIKGKRYYISRDMGLEDIPENLSAGDAVLFERGGLWRVGGRKNFFVPEGVIFGAYGEGDKPRLYGSFRNYADKSLWEKETGNIWSIQLCDGNAGSIVFDGNAALGVKKWRFEDLKENYDFYFDFESEKMWLYYEGEPWEDFHDIEICQRGNVLELLDNATADNLFVGFCGSHAIVAGYARDGITVTNCEIGFVGGSMQFGETRFGNGIELQIGATNAKVKHNYVYQCYDAGITFQTWASAKRDSHYQNIDFSDNLIEFCTYGIEYFTTCYESNGLYSDYKNISFKNNIIRFSGYEWSYNQRPDKHMVSHIRGGQRAWVKDCENFVIEDNVFDRSNASIVFWWWHDEEKDFIHLEPHPGLTVKNNTYYHTLNDGNRCMNYHINKMVYAGNMDELKTAVALFDSQPKEIVWLDEV